MKNFLYILTILLIAQGCDVLKQISLQKTEEEEGASYGEGLAPRSFSLVSPANNATGVSLTPTFSWQQAVDPEGRQVTYTLSLIGGSSGSQTTTYTTQSTSYTLQTPLQPLTQYYWRVTAKDPEGNERKSSFFSFTTGSGTGGGTTGGGTTGGGTGTGALGLNQSSVRKGVICHNPASPNYLAYVYIDVSLNAYARTSLDGGITWTSPMPIPGISGAIDLAAGMDSAGRVAALFIDQSYNNNDAGAGARAVLTHYQGGSWFGPVQLSIEDGYPQLRRLPSVVPIPNGDLLFGFGYDTGGESIGDDTHAKTIRWNRDTGQPEYPNDDIVLHQATDNPVVCQQVSYDPTMNRMYYLYFDNHGDNESDGGDLWLMSGNYFDSWDGYEYEIRLVNAAASQRPGQAFLFRGNNGDYVLIYSLEQGVPSNPSSNTLYMRHHPNINSLESSPDTQIIYSIAIPTDANGRYRTVYAAQDNNKNIHVVWQDPANLVYWAKINTWSYAVETIVQVADNSWLDSISVGNGKLYVSVVNPTSLQGEVIALTF